ncbi:MAG: hypothetical protein U1F43_37935 [Myxococcota bacterium]
MLQEPSQVDSSGQPGFVRAAGEVPEVRYYRGARPIDAHRLALALALAGGLVVVLVVVALATGSGALGTVLLLLLALIGLAAATLPRALRSSRTMLWLTARPGQLASLLPNLAVLTPWSRPENGSATPPDDLHALVAELSKEGTVTLGGLDGFTVTQQVFAHDMGQKVLDQFPPGEPMMGSPTRVKVEPQGAA